MTRNNRAKFKDASSPTSPSMKDDFSDLPDLSTFRDEEKQHILDVLERDEHLRSRHLSRFTNLRKEVTDLEQLSQQVSASMCARCKTPFGYIFNTGDACPKCSAKVCKQCRLLYNANDNGWLCQLCCKQMQLMSYSGEWLYTMNNKFKKTSDDNKAESNLYAASAPNSIIESSSDSEPEIISTTVNPMNRFQQQIVPSKISKQKANNANSKTNKMIVQSEIDEQKLKFIRDHIKRRPVDASFTQPLPRRTLQLPSTSNTVFSSSEDVNPVSNQVQKPKKQDLLSPKKIDVVVVKPQSHENLKVETKDDEIDRKSIASSEWIDPSKKSKRHRLKLRPSRQQSTNDSKLSLESISTEKPSHKHLSASMQNLRDTVHRITPSQLLSSRTSLATKNQRLSVASNAPSVNDNDATAAKMPAIENRLDAPIKHEQPEISVEQTKKSPDINRQESSLSVVSTKKSELQPKQNLLTASHSIATTNNAYHREGRFKNVENHEESRTNRTASVGTRASGGDSDDDIDRNFRKVKLDKTKRSSSFLSLRGSQLSLNSGISESKANYDLDITGTIEIRLSFNLKSTSLEIFINKCTNLARAKRNQTSNPYCKCYLLPDPSKSSKSKTSVKKHTTDPVFAETLRYHLSSEDFSSRIIWISVWNQSSLGRNDFLGEIHIPLAHCTLDKLEEYTLQRQMPNDDLTSNMETQGDSNTLQFELTFVEDRKNKEVGTIQISAIQGIGISYGKHPVDAICKGILMPDKLKRKLPTIRKGPSPKWDVPLRWENIRRKNLPSTSLEISIWSQERFRKTMIGSIQLHSTPDHTDNNKSAKGSNALKDEKSIWEAFLKDPTKTHNCRLPLRSNTQEK